MSDKTNHIPADQEAALSHEKGFAVPVSRRNLLASSAGLAVGSMLGASSAAAQSADTIGSPHAGARHCSAGIRNDRD